ncbi:unnamed protein product [Taenia asiatica]|uniref:Protein kinase domain-containing protein n=1 Tax=Taenia asiatica TaxID=60517 RepID=A0A0R3WGW1_TAEAS|nr:unnamed protein product [Taenia asiatica]
MVYLEKVRVVHRDLRAANVLVDADGSVKVADFGLTKIFGLAQNCTEDSFPFRWTAPEAMVGGYEPNIKADVWSFGVLMFEVLTYGKMPFQEIWVEHPPQSSKGVGSKEQAWWTERWPGDHEVERISELDQVAIEHPPPQFTIAFTAFGPFDGYHPFQTESSMDMCW